MGHGVDSSGCSTDEGELMVGNCTKLVCICQKIQPSRHFTWLVTIYHFLEIMAKAVQSKDERNKGIGNGSVDSHQGMDLEFIISFD